LRTGSINTAAYIATYRSLNFSKAASGIPRNTDFLAPGASSRKLLKIRLDLAGQLPFGGGGKRLLLISRSLNYE
jgi:hypothetical protein